MHDRLRVHDDVDAVVGRAEQVVGLDHLEALVHQRRRVDRDLAAHRPRRVPQRLLDRDVLELGARAAAERAAGGGDDEPLDGARRARRRSAGAARSARSRPGSAARRWPRPARSRARRPTTSDSLLASATSMPSVSATIVGPRPAEPTIALSTRSALGLGDEPHEALGPGEHLAAGPRLGGAGGGVGVRERDPAHAVRARPARRAPRGPCRPTARRARTRPPRARRRRAPACRSSPWSRG